MKLNKILSSVLAASMLISCCAMNVFAASKAHTATLSATKTEALTAGETIVVSIDLDNIGGLISCQYDLNFDTTAFEIDTEKDQKIGMKKYENFLQIDWYKHITNDEESPFAAFISAPTLGYDAATGKIALQWAGSDGNTDPEYALDDYTIGKFNIKVKDNAPNGTYEFNLTNCKTGDAGENSTADITCAPITVTVGEPAPAKTTPAVTISEKTAGTTQGFLATCVVDSSKNYPVNGITINFANNKDDMKGLMAYTFTKVEAGTIKYAVNVENVPEGTDISATGTASVVQ